jgi:NADH dehydrogenase
MNRRKATEIRVDFSLKREVFFVVIGALLGAVSMLIPTIFEVGMGIPYYTTWVAFGHVVGVYSSYAAYAGISIHTITSISIGVVVGVFLYKTGILNISKISNGLIYGLFAGSIILVVFFIPVYLLVLLPEIDRTMYAMIQESSYNEYESTSSFSQYSFPLVIVSYVIMHLVFGITVGLTSSILSIKFGTRYRCSKCDISFSRIDSYKKHMTRHIVTPLRVFCNRAKFYEADVESIDMDNKQVVISHRIGKQTNPIEWRSHVLKYDYLVIALGSETNFFGMNEASKQAFTLKSLGDAIVLRNHVINMLEQADIEHEDLNLRTSLLTFLVIGGGFSGVEIVGELNDFVLDSINHFYHNLEKAKIRRVLVNSGARILPEVTEELSEFALQKLRENGIEVILNTRVIDITSQGVKLNDGTNISTQTIIWAGGGKPPSLLSGLSCEHDKSGRLVTNDFLEVIGHTESVMALGDCASITDPNTGKSCPPTAQHAIRQGKIAAINLISTIKDQVNAKKKFDYKTKGVMTLIGKRNGVGILLGYKIQGFAAWWVWRSYYLLNLPTVEKKLRVMVDWFIDLFFKRDVTRLKTPMEETSVKLNTSEPSSTSKTQP